MNPRSQPGGDAPLVSILTAVRNAAPVLESCIESVLALDRSDVEHVVVDGGSQDETALIGRALADRNPARVRFARILDTSITEGLIHAVELSRGRFLAPLNADDRYLSGMGELIDAVDFEGPRVVFGNCRILRADGSLKFTTRPWLANHVTAWHVLGCFTPECAYVFERRLYDEVGGYRPSFRFTQDYDLLVRLVERANVLHVDIDVAEFALSETSISSTHREDMLDERRRVSALGPASRWMQVLKVDKLARIGLGLQRYGSRTQR